MIQPVNVKVLARPLVVVAEKVENYVMISVILLWLPNLRIQRKDTRIVQTANHQFTIK